MALPDRPAPDVTPDISPDTPADATAVGSDADDARPVVWPRWLRPAHWALAASVIASFVTHEGEHAVHERFGWAALAVAVVRLGMGWASRQRHARFASFIHGPAATLRYAVQALRGRAPRYIGHNPLGGWMVLALLGNTVACGFTGWLGTTDAYWGEPWVEELHGAFGHAYIPLVLLHVAGAVKASFAQRENLVAALFSGRKRRAGPGDMD